MIVSVDVTSQGSDTGLMQPMYDDVCDRYRVVPDDYLVDGGFVKKDDITHVEQNGTQVYAQGHRQDGVDEGGYNRLSLRSSFLFARRCSICHPLARETC
jgi:hypothetical protein